MAGLLVLIPAAGAGRRMRGGDKLLEPVDGVPLLARQAMRAQATGWPVLVTLPPGAAGAARAEALRQAGAISGTPEGRAAPGSGIVWRCVAQADEGMAASLRAGAEAALGAGAPGMMVLPADMPDLDTPDLLLLGAAFAAAPRGSIVQATGADGTPGHPVILPAALLPQVARLSGDTGARALLRANPGAVIRQALPAERALTDLDTPEAWAAWRAARIDRP
ncbi:MAG: NTP transferase domain-containing protein [Pararhodobacter sp.]|nr:NTP transferase domain-containing protein [Pararhodobacter sp.]